MKILVDSRTSAGQVAVEAIMHWKDNDNVGTVYVTESGLVWWRADDGIWPVGNVDLWAYHEGREAPAQVKTRALERLKSRQELWADAKRVAKAYGNAQDTVAELPDNAAAQYRESVEGRLATLAEKLVRLLERINQEPMTWPQLSRLTGISALELEALAQEFSLRK